MKKKRLVFLAVLFLISCFYSGQPAADAFEKASAVEFTVTYGEEDCVKAGMILPVEVGISAKESFAGKILLYISDYDGELTAYTKEIEIAGGENAEETFFIPVECSTKTILAVLQDKEGRQIDYRQMDLKIRDYSAGLFIAVFGERKNSLEYMEGMHLEDYSFLIPQVFYPQQFPEKKLVLDRYEAVMMNVQYMSSLNEAAFDCLLDWIDDGGILIIGNGLSDDRWREWFDEDEKVIINKESEQIRSFSYGKGKAAVMDFSLSELEEKAQQRSTYLSDLFCELFTERGLQEIESDAMNGGEMYWMTASMIDFLEFVRLPAVWVFITVLMIYVILIGPVMYFFLKRKDRRHWQRRTIIGASIIFSALIFILGIPTRFNEPFVNYAFIREIDSENTVDTCYFNVRAPYNSPYSVRVNREYQIAPLYEYSYMSQETGGRNVFMELDDYGQMLDFGEDSTVITVQNQPAFTSKSFWLEKRSKSDEDSSGIECDVHWFEGELYGTIENHLGYDLENVSVVMYGKLLAVGKLIDGQSVDISECQRLSYWKGYYYEAVEKLLGEENQRFNMLQYFVRENMQEYSDYAYLTGFLSEENQDVFIENAGYDIYGTTMIASRFELQLKKDGLVYQPYTKEEPEIVAGSYDFGGNCMYEGTASLAYCLDETLEIEKIILSFDGSDEDEYIRKFSGDIYFYNQNIKEYEKQQGTGEYTKEQLADYLTENNRIIIRYEQNTDNSQDWSIQLPVVSVVGREK